MVCIAGKNEIAVNCLEFLRSRKPKEELCVCVNLSDTGVDTWQPSLLKAAQRCNVTCYSLEELYKIQDLLFLSLEFDRIICPEKFCDAKLFNVHFSLLPKYKGMYTAVWPILNGEKETGVTLHVIDHGIDTGPIIAQIAYPLTASDTCRSVYFQNMRYGMALVQEHFEELLKGTYKAVPQSSYQSSYYSKKSINYAHLELDYRQTAFAIEAQIRAFSFPEYQYPLWEGHEVVECKITDKRSTLPAGQKVSDCSDGVILSSIDYDVFFKFRSQKIL